MAGGHRLRDHRSAEAGGTAAVKKSEVRDAAASVVRQRLTLVGVGGLQGAIVVARCRKTSALLSSSGLKRIGLADVSSHSCRGLEPFLADLAVLVGDQL